MCRNYDQQEDAAMGSPVSAVIVTLYVEEFEEQALVCAPHAPTIWKRYGLHLHDLKSGQSWQFLTTPRQSAIYDPLYFGSWGWEHNPLCRHIGQYRLGRVAVYQCLQEPTHTDQYLAYDFHHPIFVKRVIVKCLYDRSKQLSETNNDFWRKETCHQSLVQMVLYFLLWKGLLKPRNECPQKNLGKWMIDFRNRQLTAIADVAKGVESIDDLAWIGFNPQAPGWYWHWITRRRDATVITWY